MSNHSLEQNLLPILEIARFAPSVHNSQPWLITLSEGIISVALNPEHLLKDGDPTGRETIISLGIFCEAISIAATSLGFKTKEIGLDNQIAYISFSKEPTNEQKQEAVDMLYSRCTDRSIYKPVEIPTGVLKEIRDSRKHPRVSIVTATEPTLLKKVAKLTSQGIQLALSSPSFRDELSHYLVVPGSPKKRGIATRSLYLPLPLEVLEPWLMKAGIGLGAEVKLEKRRWESASAVVFICSDGDMSSDWFEVGRSYLQASLAVEKHGYSQATSAAIVEASDFHEDVEQLLGTKQRIQAVIRIGKGKANRYHSPRVEAKELLATSNL